MNQNRAPEKPDETGTAAPSGSGIEAPVLALDSRIERLNRLAALGVLSAGAAHEIKNALVPVKTFIDLLLEEKPGSELAAIVRHEIDRINLLVAQMSRLCGPGKPRMDRVGLHRLIQDSLRLVHCQARARNIAIGTELAAPLDVVLGDANQLEQVFLNLLLNAMDAVSEGGRVSIVTRPGNNGSIETSIADDGQGIAGENMPRLFEPFFTTKNEGTGLGLSIVKEIITSHSGAIHAESTAGKGTVFRITLPLSTPGGAIAS